MSGFSALTQIRMQTRMRTLWTDQITLRAFQSHAPRNIQAGHLVNLDSVVEHYRQQHNKDEERKAKKLAADKQ